MRRPALCLLLLAYASSVELPLLAQTAAQPPSAPKPPVAEKVHTERPINGAVLKDDYAWLRERQNSKVRQYLEAENSYAEAVIASQKPLADRLYSETLSHIKQTDDTCPTGSHLPGALNDFRRAWVCSYSLRCVPRDPFRDY